MSSPQELQGRCVEIRGPRSVGTGYLVSPTHVGTAAHVVKGMEIDVWCDLRVGVGAGAVDRKGRLIERADPDKEDVALLVLDQAVDVSPYAFASDALNGDAWESWGFPTAARTATDVVEQLKGAKIRTATVRLSGTILDLNHQNDLGESAVLLRIDGHPESSVQGMSGSAVTVGGHLVGHLTRHIPRQGHDDVIAYGQIWASPLMVLRSWLVKHRIAFGVEPIREVPLSPLERLHKEALDFLRQNADTLESYDSAVSGCRIEPSILAVIEHGDAADTAFLHGVQVKTLATERANQKKAYAARLRQAEQDVASTRNRLQRLRSDLQSRIDARPPAAPQLHIVFDCDTYEVKVTKIRANEKLKTDHQAAVANFESKRRETVAALQAETMHVESLLQEQLRVATSLKADWEQTERQHASALKVAFANDFTMYLARLGEMLGPPSQRLVNVLGVIGLRRALQSRLVGTLAGTASSTVTVDTVRKLLLTGAGPMAGALAATSLAALHAVRKGEAIAGEAIRGLEAASGAELRALTQETATLLAPEPPREQFELQEFPTDDEIAKGLATLLEARGDLDRSNAALWHWIEQSDPLVRGARDADAACRVRLQALDRQSRIALDAIEKERALSVLFSTKTGDEELDEALKTLRTTVASFLSVQFQYPQSPPLKARPLTSSGLTSIQTHDVVRFLGAREEVERRLSGIEGKFQTIDRQRQDLENLQRRVAEDVHGTLIKGCLLSLVPFVSFVAPLCIGQMLARASDALRSANPHYVRLNHAISRLTTISAALALVGMCLCAWQGILSCAPQMSLEDAEVPLGWVASSTSYALSATLFARLAIQALQRRRGRRA